MWESPLYAVNKKSYNGLSQCRIEVNRKTKLNARRKKVESSIHHIAAEGDRWQKLTGLATACDKI